MKFRVVYLIISVLSGAAAHADAGAADNETIICDNNCVTREISELMRRVATTGTYHGAVLVADLHGTVLFEGAYGIADESTQQPFSIHTAVDIGSNAKAYAAAAMMALVRDGKVAVNDPISMYLPGVPEDKAKITIHHLLTHTSGLPDEYDAPYKKVTREEMETQILLQPLQFSPGTEFAYSDMGYALSHALIERISGLPYQTFVKEAVFGPFKLDHTGFPGAKIWKYNGGEVGVARGYTNGEERDSPVSLPRDIWTPLGGGTIVSTVHDGMNWHKGLVNGDILGQLATDQIFGRHVEDIEDVVWIGYGWGIVQSASRGLIYSHSGATASHNYYSQYLLDHELFIVTASNRIDGVYEDRNENGTIQDEEIIREIIYSHKLGASIAKAIHSNDFTELPKYISEIEETLAP